MAAWMLAIAAIAIKMTLSMHTRQGSALGVGGPTLFGRSLMFWLRYGGFIYALATPISDIDLGTPPVLHLNHVFWLRLSGSLVYGLLFLHNVPLQVRSLIGNRVWLLLQMLLGFALSPGLWFLSAFTIPFSVGTATRNRWLRFFAICFVLIILLYAGLSWQGTIQQVQLFQKQPLLLLFFLVNIASNALSILFAYAGACILMEATDNHQQLAAANRELLQLQAAIGESARVEERLRISRELHDAVGHYLTSLSIQLEIAYHRASEAVLPSIAKAQLITRVLLAQIREAVSAWQDDEGAHLPTMLEQLTRELDGIELHLDTASPLPKLLPATVHALFRSAQEAITNILRHSGARNLWLLLSCEGTTVQLSIRDDGRGCERPVPGNGLRGIRSRVEEVHGTLAVESAAGRGFLIVVQVPVVSEEAA